MEQFVLLIYYQLTLLVNVLLLLFFSQKTYFWIKSDLSKKQSFDLECGYFLEFFMVLLVSYKILSFFIKEGYDSALFF